MAASDVPTGPPRAMVTVGYFDGSSTPNPGPMGYGWVMGSADPGTRYDAETLHDRVQGGERWGNGTNNQAEYLGLIALLDAICTRHAAPSPPRLIVIRGDSQLIIRQLIGAGIPALDASDAEVHRKRPGLRGGYAVRSEKLISLHRLATRLSDVLIDRGHDLRVQWVPRDRNVLADKLSTESPSGASGSRIVDVIARWRQSGDGDR